MTERPILFSGPMVRALLDGSKTQTRRVIKDQTIGKDYSHTLDDGRVHLEWLGTPTCGSGVWDVPERSMQIASPYGVIGDRLWVRESLKFVDTPTTRHDHAVYAADGVRVPREQGLADWACDGMAFGFANSVPSIHMPRWASRIMLEVTGVRVERLDDISEADARAEGVTIEDRHMNGYCAGETRPPSIRAFRDLWESINGDASWDANPWVWVVEFKRIEP